MPPREAKFQQKNTTRYQKASEILVSLGARVNLTPDAGGERP